MFSARCQNDSIQEKVWKFERAKSVHGDCHHAVAHATPLQEVHQREVVASFETWLRNPHVFELALRLRCTALHSVTRALRMTYHGMQRNTQKYQGVPRHAPTCPKETNIIISGRNKPNNTTRSTNKQDTSKKPQLHLLAPRKSVGREAVRYWRRSWRTEECDAAGDHDNLVES